MKAITQGMALLAVLCTMESQAQQPVTLQDLTEDGIFDCMTTDSYRMKPTPTGTHYTQIGANGRSVEMIDFATGKSRDVLFDAEEIGDNRIDYICDYELSPLESHLLIATNDSSIFRNSVAYDYYIYDIKYKTLTPLCTDGRQRNAHFSPNGALVAYARGGNLYVYRLKYNSTLSVTTDGDARNVWNGVADWVCEEEFVLDEAFAWSPDSKELAYLRFDQSEVKSYDMPRYKASFPEETANETYPGVQSVVYPKAGEKNATVKANVFHIDNKTTKTMQTATTKDHYLTRIFWTGNAREVAVVRLNRRQNELELLLGNAGSTVTNAVLTDRNKCFVESDTPGSILFLPSGTEFLYMGELDGWRHIWLYGTNGVQKACLTKGDYDVTKIIGYSVKTNSVVFQAAKESPLRREIYSASLDGKRFVRITPDDGISDAKLSPDGTHLIVDHSSHTSPYTGSICPIDGRTLRTVVENSAVEANCQSHALCQRTFFEIPLGDGTRLNAWMTRPKDFDQSKQYPVLIYQYNGPNLQTVLDRWEVDWDQVLAAEGYITVSVDTRGTGARGEDFRKTTYQKLGVKESDDLIAAAKYLAGLSYVDGSRLGLWGWSYGGFMTALTMCRTDLFKAGIAVAGVYDWRYYDTAYAERFMRKPDENPTGYDASSVVKQAADLSGRILLVHGSCDDNVHLQNQMELVDALVQSGKQFDMFTYPNRNHSLVGGAVRSHLYQMMTDFIRRNL